MDNFYNFTSTEFSAAIIVFNILFSLLLQIGIAWTYKKTHKGLSYSPSFISTLIIVGILGTVVMMVIQNNVVGAFALLGAFSLIRFRTILKETRDIAFVFFALVIGISIGTNNYSIAFISTALISIIILLLDRYNIGSITGGLGLILTFNARNGFDIEIIKSILSKHSNEFDLLQTRTHGLDINTYVFSIKLKDNLDSASIIKELKQNESITDIEIITGEHSVEY